jgi:molecular chaperone HtpG
MSRDDMSKKIEKMEFAAETGKILKLMIHSLYTNRDIFLRELISNASDACDKLRYLSVTDSSLLAGDSDFAIKISRNETERTITITDNGIGMNFDELVKNIGTIASSGTQKFTEQMTGDSKKDSKLIGQFGVGFYSAFMVADSVTIFSKKAGEDKTWKWTSDGQNSYEISESEEDHPRGTCIILHLREDMDEFLDKFRISHIIKTYSDHISIPIKWLENAEEETLNDGSALWSRAKSDITEEQYKEFYKSVSHQPDTPWMTLHNKNEGAIEYTNLLYIPSSKTYDLFHPDRKTSVKLYVKRVFIAEEGLDLVPSNLRFLRGVIDSQDLPLNISRENLQYNSMIAKIKKSVSKKIYSELKKKINNEREEYEKFWNNFGACVKEGLCDSLDDKDQILDICLFKSALSDKEITLAEYIANMPADQNDIYYISGDDLSRLKNSPQLEGFVKRNIDVLLFTDTVDDFWVNVCHKYAEKEIKSVSQADIDLDSIKKIDDNDDKKEDDSNTENKKQELIDYFKKILGEQISEAKISKKLTSSPVCLGLGEGAMNSRMERYLKEQKQISYTSAKILEINLSHPIIERIYQDIQAQNFVDAEEVVNVLFDQACIIEGEQIKDPSAFSKRLDNMICKALKI